MTLSKVKKTSLLALTFIFNAIIANSFAERIDDNSYFVSNNLQQLILENQLLTIAVLPVSNFSVDPEISWYFRQRLVADLKFKGYSVLSLEAVDKALYEMGLSHAEQISLLSFEELAGAMNADLFLSGAVEQASVQHGAVYNAYVYTCSLKLQDRTGQNYWHVLEERVAKRRFALDPVNAVADIFLVREGGDKKAALSALADKMLEHLPDGPAKVLIGDSLLDAAVEIPVAAE